jgi:hypothetical protein
MAPDSNTGYESRLWSMIAGMRPLGLTFRKEEDFCSSLDKSMEELFKEDGDLLAVGRGRCEKLDVWSSHLRDLWKYRRELYDYRVNEADAAALMSV